MKRKSTLGLIGAAFLVASLSLTGCGNTTRDRTGIGNNAANDFQDGADYTRNNATNNMQGDGANTGTDNTQNITDATRNATDAAGNALNYTAQNFRDDITRAGYTVTDLADNTRNYFRGTETDYRLGGDVVRLYEYNSAADLEGDINRIAPNGMTINGTDAQFASRPYYYRKGNTLIVYEGKEPAYIDEFNRTYGNTLRP